MIKMAAMVKHLKNFLSGNQWADLDETWYEASETQMITLDGLILTYFTARSKIATGFYMGKCDNDRFFGNYCIL